MLPFVWTLLIVTAMMGQAHAGAPGTSPTSEPGWAEVCTDWDDWDKPGPAFLIHGSSYYVGTCGISSILITGSEGHIVIDGGTEGGAEVIRQNIAALGFDITDVKVLLHSHEHFDHVAGLAALQTWSGAELYASEDAAPVLATGEDAPSDPQYGMHDPFPPSRVDRIIDDGEVITLGDIAITAIATPGHTAGALSWTWESCEQDACETIVYADSISPVSAKTYRFSDFPDYVAAYRRGFESFTQAGCTLLLSTHPTASHMRTRILQGDLTGTSACLGYAQRVSESWEKRLERERTED